MKNNVDQRCNSIVLIKGPLYRACPKRHCFKGAIISGVGYLSGFATMQLAGNISAQERGNAFSLIDFTLPYSPGCHFRKMKKTFNIPGVGLS